MKKVLVIAALLVAGFMSNQAVAQERMNVVKINPLSLALSTFNVSYERAISDSKALQLGLLYTGVSLGDTKYAGFGITPELRIYLSQGEALDSWHVSPFVRYQNVTISNETSWDGSTTSSKATLNSLGIGALVGHQWLLGSSDRISLDVFLGPSYSFSKIEFESDGDDVGEINGAFDGFGIRTGITFGIAF
ncbi:DUF3575 domain-containing protein [Cesiribacter andamanensis]|uniref:DUF3575 domain-containing protein n=1 Tax=Cesiribacter andamanensis AMV16 TaxID=1279009 RepID=M7NU81_9BACT|nr:DUF3575 domain-containing protein [Cesiribacter andamanensis]EMR02049.1 hypothetical protein ADICEAN_02795 [Cesiribacter andamanensis AMV16]